MSRPEFQAVVLAAGKGSRFSEVCSQKPKCLLPIGNLPMIWYPLNMLQKIGFQDVIVITHEHCKSEVSSIPKRYGLDGLKLDVVCPPPASATDDLGTADALRSVHDKLNARRIMVLSSDLITDLAIHHLTDLHRVQGAALTALFAGGGMEHKNIPVPGPKSKPKKEKDLVGIDHSNGQLCYLSSEADLDEFVTLRRSLLKEHPRIRIHSNLMDAHFYIIEKWVVDFLKEDESFASVKGELIPFLVKKQFSKTTQDTSKTEEDTPNPKAKGVTFDDGPDIHSFIPSDPLSTQGQLLSSWNDHSGDLKPAFRSRPLRCYAYLMDGGTCVRANNLYSYCDLNRNVGRIMPAISKKEQVLVHPSAQIQPKAQVGSECLVGESTHVSDKTTTKNSLVGSHCRIEEKTRITNCIVMDNVTVKEGCQLTGSLVCDGATLPERCEIKDCIVGKGYKFSNGAKHSNEVLIEEVDHMMEI